MHQKLLRKSNFPEFHPRTSITVISKGRIVSIEIDKITHVSKYGNESVIYTASNSYRTCHSLKELLNELKMNDFFHVHQSHIVSLLYMASVRKGRLIVGEYYVPISKSIKLQVIAKLSEILDRQFIFFEFNPENKITHESSVPKPV